MLVVIVVVFCYCFLRWQQIANCRNLLHTLRRNLIQVIERGRERKRDTHAHRQLLALGQLSPFDGQLEMHSWQQQLVFHLPIFQENRLLISAEVLRKFRASVYLRDTWVYFWKQIQILKTFGLFIKCLYFWWILFAILKYMLRIQIYFINILLFVFFNFMAFYSQNICIASKLNMIFYSLLADRFSVCSSIATRGMPHNLGTQLSLVYSNVFYA